VPFAGCALDTLRDVYLLLEERGDMEPTLFLDLARAYRARGDARSAEALYRTVLRRYPLSARDQVELGALYNDLRRFALAESLLATAVTREDIAEGWFQLGFARLQLADGDGAAQAFRRYVELEPEGTHREEVLGFLEGTQTR
jgi:tetratricopeptide (TPR) repeat protein